LVCTQEGVKNPFYRQVRIEVLSLVRLIPLQKLSFRFSPKGLRKLPYLVFFLDLQLCFCIFNPSKSEFLSFHFLIISLLQGPFTHFRPALRMASTSLSTSDSSLYICLPLFVHKSIENFGLILRTSAVSARASFSRPIILYVAARL